MAGKPVPPDEWKQRSLEGTLPEDGELRSWLRDLRQRFERWAWVWAVMKRAGLFITAGSAFLLAIKAVADLFVHHTGGSIP